MHANDFSKTSSHTSKPATSKRKIHEEGQENPPRKKVTLREEIIWRKKFLRNLF